MNSMNNESCFIEGTLDSPKYEQMLRNDIVPANQDIFNGEFKEIWFQQDRALPHYARRVCDYLNEILDQK